MKTFNDLTATSQLENGAILPANNAANTVTNKITFQDLKSQILGSTVSEVSLTGTTLSIYHANSALPTTFTTQDTWEAMVGASDGEAGSAGYVPAPPASGYNTKYLRADGTWVTPPNEDTHYTSTTVVADTGAAMTNAAATNGNVYLNHVENGAVAASHKIQGTGATTVVSDASGHITIDSSDTHYASNTVTAATAAGTSNAEAINGNVYLNHVENGAITSSHKIVGSGATEVTADSSGNITVNSTNTWDAMTGATSSAAGTAGYVPAPASSGYDVNFLGADGTWKDPLAGLGSAATADVVDTYDPTSTDAISGVGVAAALATLPEPMVFKGSLGTGGTIATLPAASASGSSKNTGFTYKVIENGIYQTIEAKVGDTFISTGSTWILIPSGDEPSGTVTSVGITQGTGISVSGGPVTTSGSITVSHGDTSDLASTANTGRTYIQNLTVDDFGHVTAVTTATESVTDTWNALVGATENADGTAGYAPAPPSTGYNTKYLRADGTWAVPPDTNTTYTPAALGFGYGTCSTANGTAAKVVNITDFVLGVGGIVSVLFTYAVDAAATLNVNNTGAKPIYYNAAAITAGLIKAGVIATMIYDGTNFNVVAFNIADVDEFDGGDEGQGVAT